ncbi:hypothetical protein [Novosphingobium naphthalenivorans]|uniref:hypothetical protein n=1 Tax=Novosphingobium naphthalenivorans TaxID=273168 RepID=UPI0012ECE4E3|nr:hypothetical protein [Novosphingobium naphthalenivorans]
MPEPQLYSERPILSLPLRLRLETAVLSFIGGLAAPVLPSAIYWVILLVGLSVATAIALYALNSDSDHIALISIHPKLERWLLLSSYVGMILSGFWRWKHDNFAAHDAFPFFMLSISLLASSRVGKKAS